MSCEALNKLTERYYKHQQKYIPKHRSPDCRKLVKMQKQYCVNVIEDQPTA